MEGHHNTGNCIKVLQHLEGLEPMLLNKIPQSAESGHTLASQIPRGLVIISVEIFAKAAVKIFYLPTLGTKIISTG